MAANATSAVAVFPGCLGGAWGFRQEIARFDHVQRRRLAVASLAGGVLGALILMVTPARAFGAVVPWLLLFATLLVAAAPRLLALARGVCAEPDGAPNRLLLPGAFAVSVYGGYFNGGLGILLMALFSAGGVRDLTTANAMRNALSSALGAVSVVVFAAARLVRWPEALLMMVAATAGGYMGARMARLLPPRIARGGIVAIGLAMSAAFFDR